MTQKIFYSTLGWPVYIELISDQTGPVRKIVGRNPIQSYEVFR